MRPPSLTSSTFLSGILHFSGSIPTDSRTHLTLSSASSMLFSAYLRLIFVWGGKASTLIFFFDHSLLYRRARPTSPKEYRKSQFTGATLLAPKVLNSNLKNQNEKPGSKSSLMSIVSALQALAGLKIQIFDWLIIFGAQAVLSWYFIQASPEICAPR
jgi:hypothetical protein